MLSAQEAARKWAAQRAARETALKAQTEWRTGAEQPLVPAPWREETQAERADGPDTGKSPSEILRELQEQQAASVMTAAMPGPEAWADYEAPLPGGEQAHSGQAVKGGDVPLTPGHSAAEGAMDELAHEEVSEAGQLRRRIQHEVDPVGVPEVDCAELGKRYRQVFDVPADYPPFRPVSAEEFRSRPVASPGQPVPVPSAALAPGMICRPLLTDGQARTTAQER